MTKRSQNAKGSAKPPGVYTYRGSRACGALVNGPESSVKKRSVDQPGRPASAVRTEAQRVLIEMGAMGKELAKATGKTPQACSKWMRGTSLPDDESQRLISRKWPTVTVDLWRLLPRDTKEDQPEEKSEPVRVIVSEAQRILAEKGISLVDLAKATGKTRQMCWLWMHGRSKPGEKDQEKIAAKYPDVGVNLWTLMPRFPEQNCLHPSDDEPKEPTQAKATELKDLTARDGALAYLLMIQNMRADEAKRKGTNLLKLIEIERRALLDFAKFNGELSATEESRLTETKRWAQVRSAISKTLAKFPDAARAVAESLRQINVS